MKNSQPLVSIIVPIYNVEKYLDKCIKSIIKQTYKNIEIILVDDGSIDNSGKIADGYSKVNKNITTIHKENGGLSSARNTGIENAKGEWIAFIDSDDYIDKDFVKEMLGLAKRENADIVTCRFRPFSEDGSVLKKDVFWPEKTMSGEEAIDDTLKNKRPAYIGLGLYKTSLFKEQKIEFPFGREYEDIATKVKLLFFAKKVASTNNQLYNYLMRRDSITGRKFTKKRFDDFTYAVNEVKRFLKGHNDRYVEYFVIYSYITLLNYLAREDEYDTEKKQYWKSIRKTLKESYKKATFPSLKAKILYKALITISSNKKIYSMLYRKAKK